MQNSSIKDFENALFLLDHKFNLAGSKRIVIKAIGGFAMMYYGFRENGYTIDIDSLTDNFGTDIEKLIHEVADELELDKDWLNTDCASLDGFLDDLENKIRWIDSKYDFNNIEMKIADIPGLVRSKAKAIHDGGLVPRSTDKKDLLSILRNIGIQNIKDLNANNDYCFIRTDYPRTFAYLKEISIW